MAFGGTDLADDAGGAVAAQRRGQRDRRRRPAPGRRPAPLGRGRGRRDAGAGRGAAGARLHASRRAITTRARSRPRISIACSRSRRWASSRCSSLGGSIPRSGGSPPLIDGFRRDAAARRPVAKLGTAEAPRGRSLLGAGAPLTRSAPIPRRVDEGAARPRRRGRPRRGGRRQLLAHAGRGVPGAAAGRSRAGDVYYASAGGLLDAVREGGTSFEHVHGEPFFDHLDRHPDLDAAFQGSMAGRADQEARDVVAAYDFSGSAARGRRGRPRRAPRGDPVLGARSRGVLMDRPGVLPAARAHLQARGRRARRVRRRGLLRLRAGGCRRVPAVAGAARLGRRRRRASCRVPAAMAAGSRLLVVDAVLPERAVDARP